MITAKLLLLYFLNSANITGTDIDTTNIDPEQVYCLAQNIYYESRNEDIRGQFAVASVTLNRVNSAGYPDTVCGVVKQITISKITKKGVCAFSWYCENDKRGKEISIRNKNGTLNQYVIDQWQISVIVAIQAFSGNLEDNTGGATHFHNPHTSTPPWRLGLVRTLRVGNHDFYKEKE